VIDAIEPNPTYLILEVFETQITIESQELEILEQIQVDFEENTAEFIEDLFQNIQEAEFLDTEDSFTADVSIVCHKATVVPTPPPLHWPTL